MDARKTEKKNKFMYVYCRQYNTVLHFGKYNMLRNIMHEKSFLI